MSVIKQLKITVKALVTIYKVINIANCLKGAFLTLFKAFRLNNINQQKIVGLLTKAFQFKNEAVECKKVFNVPMLKYKSLQKLIYFTDAFLVTFLSHITQFSKSLFVLLCKEENLLSNSL